MNIFALDPSPSVAASYHCDQHLNKMILESAQMLSTAMHKWYPHLSPYLYKIAHPNHPCTIWISQSTQNAQWLSDLMYHLDDIRQSLGHNQHSSMLIRQMFMDNNELTYSSYDGINHIFAGPLQYKLRPDLTVHQKYQEYYKLKHTLWLDTAAPMSYHNRPLPIFLQSLNHSISHNGNYI